MLYYNALCIQVEQSSGNLSTTSMKDSDTFASPSSKMAVYKGLKVAVYIVDKTEVNLTRQNLIELINVCSLLLIYQLSSLVAGHNSITMHLNAEFQLPNVNMFVRSACLKVESTRSTISKICETYLPKYRNPVRTRPHN